MPRLLKYFLVGAGIFAAILAFIAAVAGIILGIGSLIDHNPIIAKYVEGTLITLAVITFLTFYGWLICETY